MQSHIGPQLPLEPSFLSLIEIHAGGHIPQSNRAGMKTELLNALEDFEC